MLMTQVSAPPVVAHDAAFAGALKVTIKLVDAAASKAVRRREKDTPETAREDAVVIPKNSPKTRNFTGRGIASKSW